MKRLILIAVYFASTCSQPINEYEAFPISKEETAYHQNKAITFRDHLIPFNKRLALEANYYTKSHFIISAHSIWRALASKPFDTYAKERLFSILNLPDDASLRQDFDGVALYMDGSGVTRSQFIALDDTVDIKESWKTLDKPFGMPDYISSVAFDKSFGNLKTYIESYAQDVPYSDHTVLLDHLMFESLWGSNFSDKAVQNRNFYNRLGNPIANMEYLRIKDRFRIAHSPNNVTVLEVPVGTDDRYTMLFAIGGTVESMVDAVFGRDIFSDLTLTEEPIDVAIPRLYMSSGLDMGSIFKNLRNNKEFTDPSYIRQYHQIAASPMGYFQLVSVDISDFEDGDENSNLREIPSEEGWNDLFVASDDNSFMANRPFLFALFKPLYLTDIRVPLFTGVYSFPGEKGEQKVFD